MRFSTTKGSHDSPNLCTFKCSGETFQNSLYHFPKHKSVLASNFSSLSVSCKITPLYFFRLNGIHFEQKEPFIKFLSALKQPVSFSSNFVYSVSWDVYSLYFFRSEFYILSTKGPSRSTNLVKFQKILKLCTLIRSYCPNHIKFQLKKFRIMISYDTER